MGIEEGQSKCRITTADSIYYAFTNAGAHPHRVSSSVLVSRSAFAPSPPASVATFGCDAGGGGAKAEAGPIFAPDPEAEEAHTQVPWPPSPAPLYLISRRGKSNPPRCSVVCTSP
ncbi:MAG: hypothetical protein ACI8QZ_004260 [Chlamydiales bacterium]|jgi:hypothetical protein